MSSEPINHEPFQTDSTPLAAHLITEGFKLLDIIFNGKVASFLFPNDDPQLQSLVHEFELMRAPSSDAAALISNYQMLVRRIRRGY